MKISLNDIPFDEIFSYCQKIATYVSVTHTRENEHYCDIKA